MLGIQASPKPSPLPQSGGGGKGEKEKRQTPTNVAYSLVLSALGFCRRKTPVQYNDFASKQ